MRIWLSNEVVVLVSSKHSEYVLLTDTIVMFTRI